MIDTEKAIDAILAREGGYVDHPDDKGGPTNHGITQVTLADWRKKPVSVEDVKALTETEARAIYKQNYIVGPGFDHIQDQRLFDLVVDCAVNHGVSRAEAWYASISGLDVTKAFNKILASRIKFYGQIISKNPNQSVFAAGWLNRVAGFLE